MKHRRKSLGLVDGSQRSDPYTLANLSRSCCCAQNRRDPVGGILSSGLLSRYFALIRAIRESTQLFREGTKMYIRLTFEYFRRVQRPRDLNVVTSLWAQFARFGKNITNFRQLDTAPTIARFLQRAGGLKRTNRECQAPVFCFIQVNNRI